MFDLTVTRFNKKGEVVEHNPYKLVIENGTQKFERPPGSGMWYAPDGKLISSPKKDEQKVENSKEFKEAVKVVDSLKDKNNVSIKA